MFINTVLSIVKKTDYYKITPQAILNNDKISVDLVENKTDIYNDIARIMANKLKENNYKDIITSFILPVGPREQYKRFARICNIEKIRCNNLVTINMDEYLDSHDNYIDVENPFSFRGFMEKNLFRLLDNRLKIRPENIFFPNPKNPKAIAKLIKDLGGVDICFGGVGINGHIAFNEPVSCNKISAVSYKNLKTRVLDIAMETRIMNSLKYGGAISAVPRRCITIGMQEILNSKEIRLYLEHNWQSLILRKAIFEDSNVECPVTFLKEHRNSSITISRNVLKKYI